jgi:hypothetical protein
MIKVGILYYMSKYIHGLGIFTCFNPFALALGGCKVFKSPG